MQVGSLCNQGWAHSLNIVASSTGEFHKMSVPTNSAGCVFLCCTVSDAATRVTECLQGQSRDAYV